MNTLGKKLRLLLEEQNIKQATFANMLGISPSRLSNYLSDKREPDIETLAKMAKHLNTDLNYFSNNNFTYKPSCDAIMTLDHDEPLNTVNIPLIRLNAKKKAISHNYICIDKLFLRHTEHESMILIEITATLGNFNIGDHVLAVKFDHLIVKNGDLLIATGRNSKIYEYIHANGKPLLISADENIIALKPSELKQLYIAKAVFINL